MTEQEVLIQNKTGIHARPASIFVQTASKFKSKIQVKAKGKAVDAKSILMLMSMGLVKGTDIVICAEGPDEQDAVKTLVDLVNSKFGEN
jgi:phosphocarrier protein HPr